MVSSSNLRLFLALWPPAPVRDALQALQRSWRWPQGAALVARGRLHGRLHFPGQVPLETPGRKQIDALTQRLEAAGYTVEERGA